jgi:hypothetical protein
LAFPAVPGLPPYTEIFAFGFVLANALTPIFDPAFPCPTPEEFTSTPLLYFPFDDLPLKATLYLLSPEAMPSKPIVTTALPKAIP